MDNPAAKAGYRAFIEAIRSDDAFDQVGNAFALELRQPQTKKIETAREKYQIEKSIEYEEELNSEHRKYEVQKLLGLVYPINIYIDTFKFTLKEIIDGYYDGVFRFDVWMHETSPLRALYDQPITNKNGRQFMKNPAHYRDPIFCTSQCLLDY